MTLPSTRSSMSPPIAVLTRARAVRGLTPSLVVGIAALMLLTGLYLVSLASPLRLAWDSVVYLLLARRIVTGEPYHPRHEFPTGYPHLLALLEKVGLGVPWGFVALNLVFLAIGVSCSYLLFRRPFGFSRVTAVLACGVILLVHDVIAVAAIPGSDSTFFGVAMACLLLLERSRRLSGRRAITAIAAAGVLAAAAFEVRTIGVALWPALFFACLTRPRIASRLKHAHRNHPFRTALIGVASLVAVAVAGFELFAHSGYRESFFTGWGASPSFVAGRLRAHLNVLGELASNAPASRWPPVIRELRIVPGVLLLALAGAGAIRRRQFGVTEVFALSVAVVLVAWPLGAPRLWMPIVPVLIGYLVVAARALTRVVILRVALVAYALLFAAGGAAMLANSTRLSLAGSRFADYWDRQTPLMHATYQVAFCRATAAAVGPVHANALRVLRLYEPRAAACARKASTRARTKRSEGPSLPRAVSLPALPRFAVGILYGHQLEPKG